MLVFDRGYTDYTWSAKLRREDVHFVTRPKKKASCAAVETRAAEGAGVIAGEVPG